MKKHDEGYALLLVLVTLVVLGIMSAALMSLGVRNLKNQKASVERMVDKYSAQGEIEKQVAQIEESIAKTLDETGVAEVAVNGTTGDANKAVASWIAAMNLPGLVDTVTVTEEGMFTHKIPLTAKSESEKTQISCELALTGTVKEKAPQAEGGEGSTQSDPVELNKTYEITFVSLNYTSYEMTEGGAE